MVCIRSNVSLLLAAVAVSAAAAKTEVSVCGDATYEIESDNVCSGTDDIPGVNGACPQKGNKTKSHCYPNLLTYSSTDGTCTAKENAVCMKMTTGAYGCVFPSIGCTTAPSTGGCSLGPSAMPGMTPVAPATGTPGMNNTPGPVGGESDPGSSGTPGSTSPSGGNNTPGVPAPETPGSNNTPGAVGGVSDPGASGTPGSTSPSSGNNTPGVPAPDTPGPNNTPGPVGGESDPGASGTPGSTSPSGGNNTPAVPAPVTPAVPAPVTPAVPAPVTPGGPAPDTPSPCAPMPQPPYGAGSDGPSDPSKTTTIVAPDNTPTPAAPVL